MNGSGCDAGSSRALTGSAGALGGTTSEWLTTGGSDGEPVAEGVPDGPLLTEGLFVAGADGAHTVAVDDCPVSESNAVFG